MNATLVILAGLKSLVVVGAVMGIAGFLTWVDRRQGAMLQDRVGPNRAVLWLPTRVAQGLLLLPALGVAGVAVVLPSLLDAEGPERTEWAFVFTELALFALWSTLLVMAGRVRRRGIRGAFDLFLASIGDPRLILYVGLGVQVGVALAGLMLRGTPVGFWLREVGYRSGPFLFAFAVLGGAIYAASILHRKKRVGWRLLGLFHLVADGIKLAFKEDLVPPRADRFLYGIAPFLALFPALVVLGVVPFGDTLCFGVDDRGAIDWSRLLVHVPREGVCSEGAVDLVVASANVGLLFVLALAGTAVVGMAIAGWSSDNKFSLLGGLRAASQLISYEVTLGLAAVGAVMTYGSLRFDDMIRWQAAHTWGVFVQPVGCLLFFAAAVAESKRIPFDLPEGESEIVAGYFTEYSGMKFAMFYFSEYAAVVVVAALMTSMFFGGWHLPFLGRDGIRVFLGDQEWWAVRLPHVVVIALGVLGFLAKVLILCWLQVGIRWTLPRLRFDQLMRLGWRLLLPVSVLNLLVTGLLLLLVQGAGESAGRALAWVADGTQLLVVAGTVGVAAALVSFWLRPVHKQRDPMTSAVRAAAALGGTRAAGMGA
jgi:NADH-quinone oxidoreductase subunit H